MSLLAKVIAVLIAIESVGDPVAVGDHGQAHGLLQIHRVVIRDVNRIYGTRYRAADRFDPAASREICRLYLSHYARAELLGREPTAEDMVRIWNGGPDGWREPSTIAHWRKAAPHFVDPPEPKPDRIILCGPFSLYFNQR